MAKRNPADLTLRNLTAAKKRMTASTARLAVLEDRVDKLETWAQSLFTPDRPPASFTPKDDQ